MSIREDILDRVSGILADVCDQSDAEQNWRHEADLLITTWVQRTGTLQFDLSGLLPMIDWWQTERAAKNSDFPLGGAQ